MAPSLAFLVPLENFQWMRVHWVFGPMVQNILNIILTLKIQWNQNFFFEQLGHTFDIFWSFKWLVGDIKSWIIFIFGNFVTNENSTFNENGNWRLDLGKIILMCSWCFLTSRNE